MKIKLIVRFLAFIIVSLSIQNTTLATTLYKWTSSDGKVTYQDQPPPEGQTFEEKSLRAPVSSNKTENERAIVEASEKVPILFLLHPIVTPVS